MTPQNKKKTIADEIKTIINTQINNIPTPTTCTITKTYTNNHVDITTPNGDLNYIPTHGKTPTTGDTAILIYLDNDTNQPRVII